MNSSPGLVWFKSSYSGSQGDSCVEIAMDWRTSSYSGSEGDNCVEVAAAWRKSRHSGSEGDDCVEVSDCPHAVHVRDSKDITVPGLTVGRDAWTAFLGHAVAGHR